jgi:hypothetical protein
MNDNSLNFTNQNTTGKQAANSTVRGGELNGLGDVEGEGVAIGDFGSRQRGGDVKGIGMIQNNLIQSQERDQILGGMNDLIESYHKPGAKMLDSNTNSYLNNSSVAKTAVHKRRNVSIGSVTTGNNIDGKISGFGNTNDVYDVLDNSQHLNGISRPNINNTYDGSTTVSAMVKSNIHSYNANICNLNDSGLAESDRMGDRSQNS